MLEVCLLGTGGTVPLPQRWLTSCYIRCRGESVLIDCGEGTQIALHEQKVSCKQIGTILLTHYHADHTAGLPGMLLTMAKSERTEPVTIIGPPGLKEFLDGVFAIARYVPFEIRYAELAEDEVYFQAGELKITAFAVKHSVKTYGYCFELNRSRRFDPEKARRNQIPVKLWSCLQKGEKAEADGVVYKPDQVLGEERKGLKMVYVTDTRPADVIYEHAKNADLLIAEGMYGDPECLEKAKKNRHMLMQESAAIAARAGVKRLWFTHYSPSVKEPEIYLEEIEKIYPGCVISHDGQRIDLAFENEENEHV